MKLERLFAILFILLERKNVTAKILAERFEVSTRTIYRDIDTLSAAGIPVYADRGRNGGIFIMEHFVFDKSLLNKEEQAQIISSLQALEFVEEEAKLTSDKLKSFFAYDDRSWIDVDYQSWGNKKWDKNPFSILKEAIHTKRLISFAYYSMKEETTFRTVEPYQVIYKGQDWYVYGYCLTRHDFRYFKLTRIQSLQMLDEKFEARQFTLPVHKGYTSKMMKVKIKVHKNKAYRVLDEMREYILQEEEDSYIVQLEMEENWLYNYLLTFQDSVEVLQPVAVRNKMKDIIHNLKNIYKI